MHGICSTRVQDELVLHFWYSIFHRAKNIAQALNKLIKQNQKIRQKGYINQCLRIL